MGEITKEILKKANILPRLKLGIKTEKGVKTTGKHYVTLVEEKPIRGKTFNGEVVEKVRFIFDEDGEKKRYDVPMKSPETGDPHYFIQSMADVKEGDQIVLEMVKKGPKNVINVQKLGELSEVDASDDHDDDIQEDLETINIA